MTNILGLPLEYQKMPEYFDMHNVNDDTEKKNAVIEQLLKEQQVKTILDMTCGTGSQVFYLAQKGYKIVGSDFSPALLEQARIKAHERGLNIDFVDGDMRDLHLGHFDSVITMFNAIGHVSKLDFHKVLQNIRINLNDSGIYVFDILNLEAMSEEVIDDFEMDIQTTHNGKVIRNQQYSEIDRKNGLITSHDKYTISDSVQEPEVIKNSFSLQIYSMDELKGILSANDFEVLKIYDIYGKTFIATKSLNILIVARKKK